MSIMSDRWYRALKRFRPDLYRQTVESIEAVTLNYEIDTRAAAEYEMACIYVVCQAIGLKPETEAK